jgi:hypothetical protein
VVSFLDEVLKLLGSTAEESPAAEPEEAPSMASLMMQQKDLLEPFLEASSGLREDLIGRGFTEEIAQMLSGQYLSLMLVAAFGQTPPRM